MAREQNAAELPAIQEKQDAEDAPIICSTGRC